MHSLIWFFFLRFCQHEIKHSNPIQSEDKGLKDIGHSMNIRNLTLGVNSVTVSYLICNDSLLQNGTSILLQNVTEVYYIMRQFFTTKCNSFIIKCNSYYKLGRFYYKMRQLLEMRCFLKLRQCRHMINQSRNSYFIQSLWEKLRISLLITPLLEICLASWMALFWNFPLMFCFVPRST